MSNMSRIKAIRVACSGEVSKGVKELSTYNILDTNDVFTKGQLSDITNLVSIPLLVLKMRPSMLKHDPLPSTGRARTMHGYSFRGKAEYYPNLIASTLMAGNANRDSQWRDEIGSVLIARADKISLEKDHLQIILRLISDARTTAATESVEKGLRMLTPEYFKAYYLDNVLFLQMHLPKEQCSDHAPWNDQQAPAEHVDKMEQIGVDDEDEEL